MSFKRVAFVSVRLTFILGALFSVLFVVRLRPLLIVKRYLLAAAHSTNKRQFFYLFIVEFLAKTLTANCKRPEVNTVGLVGHSTSRKAGDSKRVN